MATQLAKDFMLACHRGTRVPPFSSLKTNHGRTDTDTKDDALLETRELIQLK